MKNHRYESQGKPCTQIQAQAPGNLPFYPSPVPSPASRGGVQGWGTLKVKTQEYKKNIRHYVIFSSDWYMCKISSQTIFCS